MRRDGGSIVGENKTTYNAGTITDTTEATGYRVSGGSIVDSFFTLNNSSTTQTTSTVEDELVLDYTSVLHVQRTKTVGRIETIYTSGTPRNKTFSSSNESIISIASNGDYIQNDNGEATITVVDSSNMSASIVVSPPDITTETVTISTVPEVGSFRKSVSDSITNRITGLTGQTSEKLRFSVQDHSTPLYIKNPDLWANDVDFSACSPWNNLDGPRRAGTLVSPRHVLGAAHYPLYVGNIIRFVSDTGIVVEKTVVSVDVVASTDIILFQLDSDVPNYIKFVTILPQDYYDYLPPSVKYVQSPGFNSIYANRIPCISLDQEEKVLVNSVTALGFNVFLAPPTTPPNSLFYEQIIVGDSGNPIFLLNGNRLVLLFTFNGASMGPSVLFQMDAINQIMATHPNSYQLTVENLTSFNKYPHA